MTSAAFLNMRPASVHGRPPNLPVIEHPMSRMGDRNMLNIMGSNRGNLVLSTRSARPSPDLEDEVDPPVSPNFPFLKDERGGRHSRTVTWPASNEHRSGERRAKSARIAEVVPRQKFNPEKFFSCIKDQLTTGYHGFHQQFKINDPQGKEAVSKGALARILFHLVGYVTLEEVKSLLEWMGLSDKEKISFDDFISHFRDNETVKKSWLSAVARKELKAERNPHPMLEAHLKHSSGNSGQQKYVEASYANAFLKEKCKHSNFDIRKHLPPACFEPDGIVLAPQLRDCLASMGVLLYDEDIDLLWSRYDKENIRAIPTTWFFQQIGLDSEGRYISKIRRPSTRNRRFMRTPEVPHAPQEKPTYDNEENERPDSGQRERLLSPDIPRPPSTDVISFLLRKVEETFYSILMSCEHFDPNGDGIITKAQFKEILREYGVLMHPYDMENMLERCNLLRRDGLVSYKDFLYKFMSRNINGIAHRIMMDPEHRFNTRLNTPPGFLSAGDAEAKIMELLHKDFLKMLGQFQKLDPHHLNLVTETQFRNVVDGVFGIHLSDKQLFEILAEVGMEYEGLVPYPDFLAIFNKRRLISSNLLHHPVRAPSEQGDDHNSVIPPSTPNRDLAESLPSHNRPNPHQRTRSEGKEVEGGFFQEKRMEGRYKPVSEICDLIEDIIRYRSHEAQDAYKKIDRKQVGRLSRTQLHYWLQELGVVLHPTELQELWRNMSISRDGLIHYAEMVDYFLNKHRRKPIIDKMKNMQRVKATFHLPFGYTNTFDKRQEPSSSRESFILSGRNVIEKIRPQVVKKWEELKNLLVDLDPDGCGTISAPEFKNLCHYLGSGLSAKELSILCSKFDFNLNNQFHYLQFMQLFTPKNSQSPPRAPLRLGSSPNKYNKNFHRITYYNSSGEQEGSVADILNKIKKQLFKDWKYLRRAFKKADLNGDGVLSIPEFKQCIRDMKIKINEEDLYYVISELDRNMDGSITYDEFLSHFS